MRHPAPEEPQPIHVRTIFLRKMILRERFESLAIPLNRVRVPIAGKRFGRSEHADECKECGIVGDCRWNSAEENLTEIRDRSLYLRINGPLRLRHRNRGVLTTNAVRTDPRESRERNGLMLADNETQLIAGFRGLDARTQARVLMLVGQFDALVECHRGKSRLRSNKSATFCVVPRIHMPPRVGLHAAVGE